jgi:hypothetical protein
LEAKDISFEQSGDYKGAQEIAGAIFETQLDLSHPINFGMPRNTMPILEIHLLSLNLIKTVITTLFNTQKTH